MNVLIVSENFLNGGLETQINTMVSTLKDNDNFFFAVREYNPIWNFKNVFKDFNFSYNSTISQFCEDVNKLINIIKENHIDIIHAHPFFSFFPAVFAAKICNKPIVYTLHGIASYSFPSRINDSILYNIFLDYEIDKIFCVSKEVENIIKNVILDKEKSIYLQNPIDTKAFSKTNIQNNKHWALISRLDFDKLNELKLILNSINSIDIKELHIYGNGNQEKEIKQFVFDKSLNNKVFFKGYCNNLSEELRDKYNGIIGIGRSAMEAISMNYPIILLGYNKISGIVDNNIYTFLKAENFSNKLLPSISIDDLKIQIQKIYNGTSINNNTFYNSFINEFDSNLIANKYHKELQNTKSLSTLNISDFFEELNSLNKEELFYISNNVYLLLKKFFFIFCRLPSQKNLFIIKDNLIETNETINTFINNSNAIQENKMSEYKNNLMTLNEKILQQDEIIKDINYNTMTLNNLKRKIKYKFKH